jgi:hypothetical protein
MPGLVALFVGVFATLDADNAPLEEEIAFEGEGVDVLAAVDVDLSDADDFADAPALAPADALVPADDVEVDFATPPPP